MLALVVMFACTNQNRKTPSGLEFKVVRSGNGALPNTNQLVVFNYKMVDSKDSVWGDTYDRGLPEVTAIADSAQIASEHGLAQMIRMLSAGDSVQFQIPVKDFFENYAKRPVPPFVDSARVLNYTISVDKIIEKDSFDAFRTEAMAKYQVVLEAKAKEQLAKDTVAIDEYLAKNNITAQKTPEGLRYVTTQEGTGTNAAPGQTAKVDYAGYLLDGTYFDTSIQVVAEEKGLYDAQRPYQPYDVVVDQSAVIDGWHQMLKLMNKGQKVTVYIPSSLAYGQRQRSEVIKPNSILVFDLHLVDIAENLAAEGR